MIITFAVLIGAIIFAAYLRSVTRQLRLIASESLSITKNVLRPVGFYFKRRLKKIKSEIFQESALLVFTLLGLASLVFGRFAMDTASSLQIISFLIVFIVSAVYVVFEIYLKVIEFLKYQRGLNSEIETAQCLNQVELMGARVFHDVPINKGRDKIDHVVVSEQGVFAIETKAWRKIKKTDTQVSYDGTTLKFPFATTNSPINDAVFHARSLDQMILGVTGEKISVKAVVSLPGWSVLPMPQHPAHQNCATLNPKNFHYLMQDKTLSAQQVAKITQQLTDACNDFNESDCSSLKTSPKFEFKISASKSPIQILNHNYYNF